VTGAAAPRVVLVRHAHADWPHYHGRDFDRPLTPRGMEDAARSAEAIRAAGLLPMLLLASPAQRTRQTAAIIANALALPETAIHHIDSLYNATAGTLELQLRKAAQPGAVTMLVAHNPGISELARQLADDPAFRPFAPGAWAQFELPPGD
jgi:phosphohistidine phosphatase